MTTKTKLPLLERVIDERDELTRLRMNAILPGETSATDCPEVVAAERKWQGIYEQLVTAIGE